MKLLLDTHVVLWSATDPERLSEGARTAIEDGANEVLVSIVSAWEIALKQSIGKLDLPSHAEQWLPEVLKKSGFEVAELGLTAALRVRSLPWHHRDPFDRLLIAHALEDGFTLVTHDSAFSSYGISLLAA
ncbi:MAG TPA: type II toxin-antitoxin system VapC family toxin [Kofleriaceae bacterium]|nr:type II toxin-antitoxin system VapC family toxin [Kofleriaceae bacterium]